MFHTLVFLLGVNLRNLNAENYDMKNPTIDLSVRSVLLNAGVESGDVSMKDDKCDELSNFLTHNNNNNNNNNNNK
jgi:hypothetical protein